MDTSTKCPITTTHQELVLDLNADVAEWCPLPSHSRLLAAGTYQLNETNQQREGRLYVYNLCGEIAQGSSSLQLNLLKTYDLPGIFDLRWLPLGTDQPTLLAALADGSLRILTAETFASDSAAIAEAARVESPNGGMALSVECLKSNPQAVVSSYSDGVIATHQIRPDSNQLATLQSWHGHDLEAWTASFDHWDPYVVYSGGDDCAFKGWDVRQDCDKTATALWLDRKSHAAGVCCIASSPYQQHIVMTGSYDEGARLWDIRHGARPIAVGQADGGGGVWRLKWHPRHPNMLLAACMHGGFAILGANAAQGSVELVERYPHQQTLGYGSGWCSEMGADGTSLVATASFYDRLLHVWSFREAAEVK